MAFQLMSYDNEIADSLFLGQVQSVRFSKRKFS